MWTTIKTNQMRTSKNLLTQSYSQGVCHHHHYVWQTQKGRWMGQLHSRTKWRLQVMFWLEPIGTKKLQMGYLEVGHPLWLVGRYIFVFSDWSSTGSGDKNYRNFQLLTKSWPLWVNCDKSYYFFYFLDYYCTYKSDFLQIQLINR